MQYVFAVNLKALLTEAQLKMPQTKPYLNLNKDEFCMDWKPSVCGFTVVTPVFSPYFSDS